MDFPNFPYTGLDNVSFLKPYQVQEYIEQFTEHFGLNKYIRVRMYTIQYMLSIINVFKSKCSNDTLISIVIFIPSISYNL